MAKTVPTEQVSNANPNFAAWFKESKVVTDSGDPLVVYHGSTAKFDAFKMDSYYGGAFFTPSEDVARDYSGGKRSGVRAFHLAIENPKTIEAEAVGYWSDPEEEEDGALRFYHQNDLKKEQIDLAKAEGHDGLLIKELPEGEHHEDQWVAFSADQIKSIDHDFGPAPKAVDALGLAKLAQEFVEMSVTNAQPKTRSMGLR